MLSQRRSGNLLAAGLIAAGAGLFNLPVVAAQDPPLDEPNLLELQFSEDQYANDDKFELIKTGVLNLAGIVIQETSFSSDKTAYEVDGIFCAFDPHLNKEDSVTYSSINQMAYESEHCGDHPYTLPLKEVVDAVKAYDSAIGRKNPPVAGLIFDTGYAGAEEVVDAILTFDDVIVVPDHDAIHDSLAACDFIYNRFGSENYDCSSKLQKELVSDVTMLVTRSAEPQLTKAYIKHHPDSSAYISMMREVVAPATSWVFHYNDPKLTLAMMTQPKKNYCIYKGRQPSEFMRRKAEELNFDLNASMEDLCAFYLSTLFDVATEEKEKDPSAGMLVEYPFTTEFLISEELPHLGLQAEITADSATATANVETARGQRPPFAGPDGGINAKVIRAANLFLADSLPDQANGNAREATQRD